MSNTAMANTAQALMDSMTPKFAVSYLRVSTRGQAERGGGHDEGFSIPAQREANKKKALSMGAMVGKEFVDRGASAKSADRPQLQAMLEYVKENADRVDYVIVHKIDRLARNRDDDSDIMRVLRECGVQLVSASESIDDTPAGMLLHGIMSSIAEFYSQNLATEVKKGMGEKIKGGGTVGRAPIGYQNVRLVDDKGREERTVITDPERIFEKFYISNDADMEFKVDAEFRPPFDQILEPVKDDIIRINRLAQDCSSKLSYYIGIAKDHIQEIFGCGLYTINNSTNMSTYSNGSNFFSHNSSSKVLLVDLAGIEPASKNLSHVLLLS